jgi:hypothetical protein
MKRKRRLERGIESLKKQIKIHEEKRKLAEEKDNPGLEDYYKREIEAKKRDKERKEDMLKKMY